MASSRLEPMVRHLRRTVLRHDCARLTDGQLLEQFIAGRNAEAFETLVRRHGPMVLSVCKRILGNVHDADDAFQASFLVLARKAGSVSPREAVGNWLHGVAVTTAHRARVAKAKRHIRERQVRDMPEPQARPMPSDDLLARLDRELSRLSDRYRVPIVLCDLEGRTRKEVARQLKIPEGTVSSRLTTGRRLLAKRLARYGLSVSGTTLTANSLSAAALPARLIADTVGAAGLIAAGEAAKTVASAGVIILMEGVLKMMLIQKLKTVVIVLVLIALACCGVGLAGREAAGQPETKDAAQEGRPSLALSRQGAESLQGVWVLKYAVADGKKDTTTKGAFMVHGNRACIQTPEYSMTGGLYLDPTSRPRAFDFVTSERTLEGIYELQGDTLRLCTILGSEAKRPHEFAAGRGRPQVIQGWKRMKGVDLSNSRRADGSWTFPEFFERPVPYQPPPRQVPTAPAVPFGGYAGRQGKPVPPPDKAVPPPDDKDLPVRIGNICIVGNESTPDSKIRDCLNFSPGEVLDYAKIRQAEKALADLKLFVIDPKRNVRPSVTVVDESGPYKDIVVTVEEPTERNGQNLREQLQELRTRARRLEERLAAINAQAGSDDFAIAEYYDKSGRPRAAALYYRLVCQRYPGSPNAELARQRLNSPQTAAKADEKKQSVEQMMFPGGTSRDFGKVARGTLLKHSFPIQNVLAVPVQIKDVRASAGCVTVVPGKHTLQPGETIGLDITLDSSRFSGPKTIPIYVAYSTESEYVVVLRVTANSVADPEDQSSSRH